MTMRKYAPLKSTYKEHGHVENSRQHTNVNGSQAVENNKIHFYHNKYKNILNAINQSKQN